MNRGGIDWQGRISDRRNVDIIVNKRNVVFSVYTDVDKWRRDSYHESPHRNPAVPMPKSTMTRLDTVTRLGVLTPSSNTALEPLTSAIAADLPGCSAHFARFAVTEISLREQALAQFDPAGLLDAAQLLSHANVHAIGWSGTSAGWLGFEADERLVERIRQRTGLPATTAVLALNELLRLRGLRRIALVTPYTEDVQRRIVDNYRALGIEVVAERHLGICVNYDFAEVQPAELAALIGQTVEARPQAVVTFCTNLRAATLARQVEREHGVLLLDTVSTTVWGMLRAAGRDPAPLRSWGSWFAGA